MEEREKRGRERERGGVSHRRVLNTEGRWLSGWPLSMGSGYSIAGQSPSLGSMQTYGIIELVSLVYTDT